MPVCTPKSTHENNQDEKQYSITKDRPWKDIWPPQKYADLVAYALFGTKKTNGVCEPST